MVGLAASTNSVLKNLGALLGITLMATAFAWLSESPLVPGTGIGRDFTTFRLAFGLAVLVAVLNLGANLLPRRGSRAAGPAPGK
jgi:hypothetical protein